MCGRYTLTVSGDAIAEAFQLEAPPPVEPRYNIAPSQPTLAVVYDAQQSTRGFTHFQWGLIPSWADDPKIGYRLINARAETVAEKPSFRNAFKRRRCLIVADGFYEWQRRDGTKQPFYFCMSDRHPFAFAGLWEHWQSKDGSEIESCTILTTTANALLEAVHNRMPVILNPNDYDRWLDPSIQSPSLLQPLLQPYDPSAMAGYSVNSVVNNPRHETPECVEPLVI